MGILSDMFTTYQTETIKEQLKIYIKVILCITVGLLLYSVIKDIVKRYSTEKAFLFKSIVALLLIIIMIQF